MNLSLNFKAIYTSFSQLCKLDKSILSEGDLFVVQSENRYRNYVYSNGTFVLIYDESSEKEDNNKKLFVPKYTNCPNCGSVVKQDTCEYCGTIGLFKYV